MQLQLALVTGRIMRTATILMIPSFVLILHLFFQRAKVYNDYSWAGIPMHLVGGIAIAYSLRAIFQIWGILKSNSLGVKILVYGFGVVLAAVSWEIVDACFMSKAYFQINYAETSKDIVVGVLGGSTYLGFLWKLSRSISRP